MLTREHWMTCRATRDRQRPGDVGPHLSSPDRQDPQSGRTRAAVRRRTPAAARLLPVVLAVAAVSCGSPGREAGRAGAARDVPVTSASAAMPSFAGVAARVLPAVVSISTERIASASDAAPNPFSAPPRDELMRGAGSGFIISADGYVVTNHHVVEGATRVDVMMADGEKTHAARVVGRDPETDIALLKIDGAGTLPVLALGDSSKAAPGEWAIAVGNPLQFANSVTVGVVSASGRALGLSEATASFENFMQTDAAINPGNSGGPLLNARGEVIGINTAMRAYAQNIGFATPINTLKRILEPLKREGRVRRGYLGVTVGEVDERYKAAFGLETTDGVLVQSVEPGGPADRAGLRRGDVVLEVNGNRVDSSRELIDAVSYAGPRKPVTMRIVRDGRAQQLDVTTGERPDSLPERDQPQVVDDPRSRVGIAAHPLTAELRQRLALRDTRDGVLVAGVKPGSPADRAGLLAGDVIVEVNGRPVDGVDALRASVQSARSGQYLRFYIVRPSPGGSPASFYLPVQIP